jgi:tetratricopeptide (TPR) repeat protein
MGYDAADDPARLDALDAEARATLLFEVEFLEGVVRRRPRYLEALRPLAQAYTEAGRYADGLRIDERIVALAPEDAVAVYNLACSQSLTGDHEASLGSLRRAWEMGYRERQHMLNDPDLAGVRETPGFARLLAGDLSAGRSVQE